ncbi:MULTISPECIES: hypothetical protein [unclassified Variovorax]|jgi:hypothetical protein|uniref:hypothetical protein n=1 Tax=unclassified Variovorax TaxID=663243 RepID=UPI000F7DE3EB|nr:MULTISPECIES: hypothetical protein [unclassified Variovorax]RSZ32758.1 hypothetical protein EJO70_29835 [Variovorax sp. 553]RSZ33005.1 hypothetical protein EJO71_29250 [Variovorax sp. 679]
MKSRILVRLLRERLHRARGPWLLLAWVALLCGAGLVYWMTPGNALEALGQAARPFEFSQVRARWGESLVLLRRVLLVDSMLIVPGYVGLFIFFARRVFARVGRLDDGRDDINLSFHLAIAIQVFAGLVDLVENGVIMRAAEDSKAGVLADAMLVDLRLLTALKWGTLGAAWLVLGWKAFFARLAIPALERSEALAWRFAGLLAVAGGFLLIGYALGEAQWRTVGLLTWLAALLAFTSAEVAVQIGHGIRALISKLAPQRAARD